MRFVKLLSTITLLGVLLPGCKTTDAAYNGNEIWKDQLTANLAVLGARNWIVIAESSFPSYTGSGVATISTTQTSPTVFLEVLDLLERGGYVKPRIMVCSELKGIGEEYAPGIKKYRTQVNKLLPGRMHFELSSRVINGLIEDAMKQYKVLVIKTSTALPYSNIYIELDSGYWNSDSETILRTKLESQNKADQTNPPQQTPRPKMEPPLEQLPELPREHKPVEPSAPAGTQQITPADCNGEAGVSSRVAV